jgi:hypothetical protein
MFQGKFVATGIVRRFAALVIVGGLCLGITAAPVSAQSLNGGGRVYGVADCYMATRSANVWVNVQLPDALLSTGAYFYTELYAKARFETKYARISAAYSPLIKGTPYNNGSFVPGPTLLRNDPKNILFGSFTGNVHAYYDIHVMWWSRLPGGQWGAANWFNLKGDPDSWITNFSNDGTGNLGRTSPDCYL